MITAEYEIMRCYLPNGPIVQVYFNQDDAAYAEKLKEMAKKQGLSISYVIRRLLKKAFKVKSSSELAEAIDRKSADDEIGKSKLVRQVILDALKK